MKVPVIWLNDYVKIDDIPVEELAAKLVNIGFEVEEIIHTGEGINNVVVGKILDIKKHEDANKLQVCMVDVGKEITTIVTGADNISVGDFVPVALDGADLPGGKKIQAAPLRGVMSYGMMCSGQELGIDDSVIEGAEINGILILPNDFNIGEDIKTALGLDQYILDISITANRPDCQSIFGIAREIGALTERKVKPPSLKYKTVSSPVKMPQITVDDFDLCPRYTARLISDVRIEPSPKWMQDRLRLAGHRPINNVVDITNYVLTEIGQPLHAFDLKQIDEEIHVRRAQPNEKIVALDEKEYELPESALVIADKSKALSIAGVMGGQYSGIANDTKDVLLEAAKFARGNIRATSRTLGLRSDSSARYERGVDWSSVDTGRERALALFSQLKVGKIQDVAAQAETKAPQPKVIVTSTKQISDLLGIEIKTPTIVKILKSLGFDVICQNKSISVTVPLFREDIDNFTDLTEEVIRYYGYDNITSTFLNRAKPTVGGLSVRQKNIDYIKNMLCSFGLYEIETYSFINPKQHDDLRLSADSDLRNAIAIRNPLSAEYSVMRTQLVGSMLKIINNNISRKNSDLALFEIAKTFTAKQLPLSELPTEEEVICLCLCGGTHDFYEMKNVVGNILNKFAVDHVIEYSKREYLHPGISAEILTDKGNIGYFGKIHPEVAENFAVPENVYVCEINTASFIDNQVANTQFVPLPKFPAVSRDLAFIVNEQFSVGEIVKEIERAGNGRCFDITLFDVYKGSQIEEGHKSLAFSFKILPADKTLTDEEIQTIVGNIIAAVQDKFQARLR